MQKLPGSIAIFIALLFLTGFSNAGQVEHSLVISKDKWKETFFNDSRYSVKRGESATFQIYNGPVNGPVLAVGPWMAGTWSARFQYIGFLPVSKAVIRGQYRTSDIKFFEASVYIEYYKNGKRIGVGNYALPPAPKWAPFEIPVKNSPPGTDAISPGFGLNQHTEGRAMFSNLTIGTDVPNTPAEFPRITRIKPTVKLHKGHFFKLEQDANKTWWFVTPGGDHFYSLGTVGPAIKEPYELRRHYAESLREMGFNSLAGWTDLNGWGKLNSILEKEGIDPLPVFYTISSGMLEDGFDYLVDSYGRTTGDGGHKFPDPFDPGFAEAYRNKVRLTAKLADGNKRFVGWFADNEISHTDLYRHVYSRHCNESFRKWLKDRYQTIEALNNAWQTRLSAFDTIREYRPALLPRTSRIYEDFRKFERIIVKRYIEVTTRIIREEDPGRLVFSNRFMLSDSSAWLSLLDLYGSYDGIAINLYPSNLRPGLSKSEKLLLRMAYAKAGKPIIISEWSVPALDSGLYDDSDNLDWSFSRTVRTQTERARQAAHVTIDFYNQPYIIGSHWFRWNDYYSVARMANRGLVQADDQPWTELQKAFESVNNKLH